MKTERQKEIDNLRHRLASLEAEQEREESERKALETVHAELLSGLERAGLSFDRYIDCFASDIKKILARIERRRGVRGATSGKTKAKKARSTSKKRQRRPKQPNKSVKIPAGSYSNIPPQPERVFVVKEKGPRPKLIKSRAEELGLAEFLAQCRIDD